MNTKLLISVSCIFATGVCLAQAPVVDAQDTSTQQTQPPATSSASALGVSSGGITSFELEQRLATIERIVDSRTESQQRMQSQVDELQADIDNMRGSIELHNHQLEKLLERQRELFLEIDRRFENMEDSTNQFSNELAKSNAAAGANNTPAVSNTADEQSMYQDAVNLILKDKDYEKAIPAFQNFLAQFPNTSLTANAHYWLGQLLYNQQNYADAKEQFSNVVDRFPDSPKRSDSVLKLGLIEKSIGNESAANKLFEQVIAEYPNSTPARLAAQYLGN